MTNYIKVVGIQYPENPKGSPKVELLVGRYNGPALEARKVVIPVGTSVELDAAFWAADLGPALGVSVKDGIAAKEKVG